MSSISGGAYLGAQTCIKEFRNACALHPPRYQQGCSASEEALKTHGPTSDDPEQLAQGLFSMTKCTETRTRHHQVHHGV
jgi:hypothetical protein